MSLILGNPSLQSTYDVFSVLAAAGPDAPALTYLSAGEGGFAARTLSRAERLAKITQAANLFTELGVGSGDAVAYLLPHRLEAHFVLWGAEAVGIAAPVNYLLRVDQIVALLRAAEAKVLVALGPEPGSDIWRKIVEVRALMPELRAVLYVGDVDPGDGALSFAEQMARQPADALTSARRAGPDDVAAYFHTGGTTGSPKLAQHTHGNQVFAAWACAQAYEMSEADVLFNGLPMFHVAAPILLTLAPALAGAHVVILTDAGMRNPAVVAGYWRLVERFGATIIGGVPTSIVALLDVDPQGHDCSTVRLCMSGAAPLSPELCRRFEARFGIAVSEAYGMTEAAGLVTLNPIGRGKIGSAGFNVPYERIEIGQMQGGGARCAVGETGIVLVSGPNVFPGYKSAADNQAVLVDGWLVTGDLGHLDEDGRLYLTGRAKDLIIRGGHNIDPAIIEEAASQHPEVLISAAIGKLDRTAGELPVVYVTLKAGAAATPADILEFVRDRIAEPPACPREVYVVDALPLTSVGKIDKVALRLDCCDRLVRAELAEFAAAGLDIKVAFDARQRPVATIEVGAGEASASLTEQIGARLAGLSIACEIKIKD